MLIDTQERALPRHQKQTLEDYLVYLKHLALYDFARKYCEDKNVLDLGCGEGYGSDALARSARFVVAADYSYEAIEHARLKYAGENLAFVVCDAQQLPFRRESFDTLVSYEVIEHIENAQAYLLEVKRVCRGVCLLSTPNAAMRLLPFQKPWNRFHKREFDHRSLRRELDRMFASVELRGVKAIPSIMEIERKRVKQNPFVAYPKMLAQMFMPRSLYEQMKQVKSTKTATKMPIGRDEERFRSSDFEFSSDELHECINLVAICAL